MPWPKTSKYRRTAETQSFIIDEHKQRRPCDDVIQSQIISTVEGKAPLSARITRRFVEIKSRDDKEVLALSVSKSFVAHKNLSQYFSLRLARKTVDKFLQCFYSRQNYTEWQICRTNIWFCFSLFLNDWSVMFGMCWHNIM